MRVGMHKFNQYIATSLEKFSQNGGEKVSNYVNAAGKVNFKYVENATKDISKIPKNILEACNNDYDKALKMYKEQYNEIFKDRVGAIVSSVSYLPVLALSNKVYPKIAQKLVNKNENKSSK